MPDRTIPFYNVIMRRGYWQPGEILLPEGFRFKDYGPGDERAWAALEYEIGDFQSPGEAECYFADTYCADESELKKRVLFLANEAGRIAGSCIAWRDRKGEGGTVASLHWLAVSPACQKRGLGKALCRKTLERFRQLGEFPVYVHTRPWSYEAIFLYVRRGFQLLTSDTFADYENQYAQAMETLRGILPAERYRELLLHVQ